jgi:SAM-dependent methyltransferase
MSKPDLSTRLGPGVLYGPFARLYDRVYARRLRDLVVPVLEQLLLPRLPPGAAVLDLGCGPGWISQALLERGFAMTGIDLDADMLALARANAPGCRLLRADARQISLPPGFAGALSTGCINELPTLSDVGIVVANVHRALVAGGLFCFDVALVEDFAASDQRRPATALVDDAFVEMWREAFDPATARRTADLTLFYRQGDGWQRCDTSDFAQLYTAEAIEGALRAAGFSGIRKLSASRDLGCSDSAGHTFFVAEKGPDPASKEDPS